MSTNCTVAIKNEDGSVTSIYGHWDGYLNGVGSELLKNYTTENDIKELIMLGDCSTICDSVEAYHRDKGEDWENVQPKVFEDYEQMLDTNSQEYNYIFENNQWYVIEGYDENGKLQDLEEAIANDRFN